MKKVVFYMMLLVMSIGYAYAQGLSLIHIYFWGNTQMLCPQIGGYCA